MNQVFIGFDEREQKSFAVTRQSLLRHASAPTKILALEISQLRESGIYNRPSRIENGQIIDNRDGKPFSTDFSFTRFLVPFLSNYKGWALFCDGDFLFLDDVANLFAMADPRYAVMCVKHRHDPVEETKMDAVVQTRYFRKNWSSLVLWNCGHPSNYIVTPDVVNHSTGQYLHAFSWLRDHEIGSLPKSWNFLAGVEDVPEILPRAIHYTLGTPEFETQKTGPYAHLWMQEWDELCAQQAAA